MSIEIERSIHDTNEKTLINNLNDKGVRAVLYQVLVVMIFIFSAWYLASNTLVNLDKQNIKTGFDFLNLEAAFGISEATIEYSPADTYGRAFLVGILNTLKVSALGIIIATSLGVFFGICRLSKNFLVRAVASIYVDLFRNIPVLLQLMFWYAIAINLFPQPREAINLLDKAFITNKGIYLTVPVAHDAHMWMLVAAFIGCGLAYVFKKWADKRQEHTEGLIPKVRIGFLIVVASVLIAYVAGGMPTALSVPFLKGFGFKGGWNMSPEFAALLIGLSIYTSTYIAEIVRSGILAVPKGQWEASESLSMKRVDTLQHIILPQSMRVAIPPLTNQFLNLTKNSSLAVSIGYPDLVSVGNTTMNQTGQAIEAILIFMAVYLTFSILTSVFMNWFNAKMALVER